MNKIINCVKEASFAERCLCPNCLREHEIQSLCTQLEQVTRERDRFKQALKNISKHQSTIGGSLADVSFTKRIADQALELSDDTN